MDKLKILIFSQYYKPDPFRVNELAEGLVELGHQVTVVAGTPNYTGSSGKSEKIEEVFGVDVIRVPTVRRRGNTISLALSYLTYMLSACIKVPFLSSKYDIVFVYQLSPILMTVPALFYSKIRKKKVALYCLDLWPESLVGEGITHDSLFYKIGKLICISLYNKVDSISITSRMFEKYFKEDLKLRHQEYCYIPQFGEDIYSSMKRKPHEGFNIVFAGNIGEAQAVENIVEAASYVSNKQVKWHIVGDGAYYQKCVELAKEKGLTDRVFFYGRKPKEDMPEFYEKADAMIVSLKNNPIISYTLPGKVQSYMAAGVPIIASTTGETQQVIDSAKCGVYCEPENPQELASCVNRIIEMDNKVLGENARNYYQENFSKDIFFGKIIDYINNTIRK